MTDMVERVARAIYDAADPTSGDQVAEALMYSPFVGDGDREPIADIMEICRSAARAAIEAMMEPSDQMLEEAEVGYITSILETAHNTRVARDIYTSMLRASLNPPQESTR